MNRKVLIENLERAEYLAKGSFTKRLLNNGLNYLYYQWYKRLIYPITKKGSPSSAALFFGKSMQVHLPAGSDLYLLGAKTHASEIRLAKFLINNLEEGMHFLDIGAHFGYFSLLASELVGKEGKVLSLEASKNIFKILQSNIKNNPQLEAVNAAAGETDGSISFYDYPLLFSEFNTIEESQYDSEQWNKQINVQKTEVDMLCIHTLINREGIKPSMIKIDVEGAEAKVLGGFEANNTYKPIIIFEYIKSKPQKGLETILSQYAEYYKLCLINEDGKLGKEIDLNNENHTKGLMDSENLVLFPF